MKILILLGAALLSYALTYLILVIFSAIYAKVNNEINAYYIVGKVATRLVYIESVIIVLLILRIKGWL